MPDSSHEFNLILQLCVAGMDLWDVTRLGAEPIPYTAPHRQPAPVTTPWPVGTSPMIAPTQAAERSADPAPPPKTPSRHGRAAIIRITPPADTAPPAPELDDSPDLVVDLAHADHPADSVAGAAVHMCDAGNEAPFKIQVCRPPGIKAATTSPSTDRSELLRLRTFTIRHIPAVVQEHWFRTQAAILNASRTNPTEILLWGLIAMPKLVLRVTRTRGQNAADQPTRPH